MFKMADHPIQGISGNAWAIICILVGCVAMHFFLEGSLVFPDLAFPVQGEAGGSLQLFDETDDKDDLVMPAGQLDKISPCLVQAAFSAPENYEKLDDAPVLPPPKA